MSESENNEYSHIKDSDEKISECEKGIKYLSMRAYSQKELYNKLKGLGYKVSKSYQSDINSKISTKPQITTGEELNGKKVIILNLHGKGLLYRKSVNVKNQTVSLSSGDKPPELKDFSITPYGDMIVDALYNEDFFGRIVI